MEPDGELEELLADQVLCAAWRLRRAIRVEAFLLAHGDSCGEVPRSPQMEVEAHDRHLVGGRSENLRRYETTIERSMYRALHELQRIQAARTGAPVAPPITVDVSFDDIPQSGGE